MIKICGITCKEDAFLAIEAGADIIGLIVDVSIKTPRNLTKSKAISIAKHINDKIKIATVLTPKNIHEALSLALDLKASIIQIHSNLSFKKMKKLVSLAHNNGIEVFKALKMDVKDENFVIKQIMELKKARIDLVLFDFALGNRTIPSSNNLIDLKFVKRIRKRVEIPFGIAGGIGIDNVASIIKELKPDLIDASSRLESIPGRKDPIKVKEFMKKAIEVLK